MDTRALRAAITILLLLCPHHSMAQSRNGPVLLRYESQAEPLHFQVTIATEYREIRRGAPPRWDATHTIYDDISLTMNETGQGTLAGLYDLGMVESWSRVAGVQSGQVRQRVPRSERITRFEMTPRGDVGVMGGGIKSLSGEEIFRRLWQIPHLLPEQPVELGTKWGEKRSVTMSYSHSSELDMRYEVVEVGEEDVWVEFSGEILELLSRSRSGQAREGTITGRLGFRPSLGAMVAAEWNFNHRTGNPDIPWAFTETREEGSMVLRAEKDEIPVEGVTRLIPENRDDSKAMFMLAGMLAIGLAVALGLGIG